MFSFSFSISLVTHSPSYRPLLLCLSQPSQDSFFDSDGDVIATGLATVQLGDHADITRTRTRRMMMLRTTTHSNNNNSRNDNNDRALQDTTSPATLSEDVCIPIQVKSSDGNNGGSTNNNHKNDSTPWLNPSDSSNGGSGSKPVSTKIIILLIINILTAFLLLFQHPFFKQTWFFLS